MNRYSSQRRRSWWPATILGLVAAVAAAVFCYPVSAQASDTGGPYQVLTIRVSDPGLTVEEITRYAERALGRSLPAPDRVLSGTLTLSTVSPDRIDAAAMGETVPGVVVVRTVDQPSPSAGIGDVTVQDDPAAGKCRWWRILWKIIKIIIRIFF